VPAVSAWWPAQRSAAPRSWLIAKEIPGAI
jgi:hypothetical protein